MLEKKLRSILLKCNISSYRIAFSTRKLSSVFPLKSKVPTFLDSNFVYSFTCSKNSSISYIGQTRQNLLSRVKNHCTQSTAPHQHIQECLDCAKTPSALLKQFKVVRRAQQYDNLDLLEALLIKSEKKTWKSSYKGLPMGQSQLL